MSRVVVACFASVVALVVTLTHADLQEALRWYEMGQYTRMYDELKGPAEEGNVTAARTLGWMLEWGIQTRGRQGLEARPEEAARWYRKAADAGDKTAIEAMGVLYATGHGVPRDPEESIRWFSKVREVDGPMKDVAGYGTLAEQREIAAWFMALGVAVRRVVRFPRDAIRGNNFGKVILLFDAATGTVTVRESDSVTLLRDEGERAGRNALEHTPAPPAAVRHKATATIELIYQFD